MKKIYRLLAMGIVITGLTGCAGQTPDTDIPPTPGQDYAASQPVSSGAGQETDAYSSLSGYQNCVIVNSSEKVTVVPDIAQVVYSVRTQAREAAACQQQNSQSAGQVIDLLKDLGIAETSIQTSDYYMNPVYDYSNNTTRVTGYESITTLTVSDIPIDGLDEILSQSVLNGINTVQSITYQASKYDESYQAALSAAVETAHKKAQILAEAAGRSVGAVLNIQETGNYSEARYTDNALTGKYRSSAIKEMALEDTAGIMAGEIQVEAGIVVEYQLY